MTTPIRKIGFIGAGNMTQSIVSGMVASGYPADHIFVSNPSTAKLDKLKSELNVQTSQDNVEIAEAAEVIVLAVKPQLMADVCEHLRTTVTDLESKLIVSIAAGIRFDKYRNYLSEDIRMIRVMPNTPSLVGEGLSGLVSDGRATSADCDFIEHTFNGVGKSVWVENEDQLDILGAVAGSGPAYFFEFMATLQKAAEALGFDHDKAREMVQQTALGAAKMASHSDLELADLRSQVTSKGGSTAKGVEVYQQANLEQISADAVRAAVKRNQEMAELF